jgi:hypothetical protein
MNFFLKSIAAFSMLLIPQIAKADLNFIKRTLFSDEFYAKEIEVKAYIITQEQACAALRNPPQEPIQLEKKDLIGKTKYLFLQVRNSGKKHTWGTLACELPSFNIPLKVFVGDVDNSNTYNIYILHLGLLGFLPNETGIPEISIKWDELYTK